MSDGQRGSIIEHALNIDLCGSWWWWVIRAIALPVTLLWTREQL